MEGIRGSGTDDVDDDGYGILADLIRQLEVVSSGVVAARLVYVQIHLVVICDRQNE